MYPSVLLLTKSKIISGVIGILSFLGFVFGVYAGIRSGIIDEYVCTRLGEKRCYSRVGPSVRLFKPLEPFVICWLGFQTSADLLITGMCHSSAREIAIESYPQVS